ncbi:hypothetical protein [Nocardioides jensenii]|uniref:hypothetical protein n=1 Tax=Nocardioides jensenii TaxID=1843 RepID=UPI00083506C8|nr:hypothetical protein [Nocardioides jensenii]
MTIAADNVQLVATRDRAVAADQRLNLAVARAVQLCREGRPGEAEYVMARAGVRAERILGSAS